MALSFLPPVRLIRSWRRLGRFICQPLERKGPAGIVPCGLFLLWFWGEDWFVWGLGFACLRAADDRFESPAVTARYKNGPPDMILAGRFDVWLRGQDLNL